MKFLRPVKDPISAHYAEWGPWWDHYLANNGSWIRGRLNGLGQHKGVDFACPAGTMIHAVSDGLVIRAGWENASDTHQGFGMRVRQQIEINGKFWTIVYGHLSRLLVREGQQLVEGDNIGLSGATGHVTGPHLHVELLDPDGQYAYMEFQEPPAPTELAQTPPEPTPPPA